MPRRDRPIFTEDDLAEMAEAADGIAFGAEALAYFVDTRWPKVARPEPRVRRVSTRKEDEWR